MMKSVLAIVLSLLLTASSILAHGQNTRAEPEGVRRAEQLADRFVRRFKETLDFEVVYREFFSVHMAKRLMSTSMLWSNDRHEEIMKQISPAEAEQAYISFMNLYYLVGLYQANFLSENEEGNDEIKFAEVFPPELVQAMKEPTLCPYFSEYNYEKSCEKPDEFQDAEDLRQFISDANRLAPILRKYLPSEPFDSPKYLTYIKQFEWNGRETSVDEGEDEFGTGEKTTNYQVYRELFALDIVEENGEMRVRGIPIGN